MDLAVISSTPDISDDWIGRPRASRDEVIATIRAAVPRADFSYPARGQSEERGYSVEVNLGDNDPVMSERGWALSRSEGGTLTRLPGPGARATAAR